MSRERWRTGNQSSARMQKMKLQRRRKEEKSIIAKIRSRRKKKQMRKREKEELRRGHWKGKGMRPPHHQWRRSQARPRSLAVNR